MRDTPSGTKLDQAAKVAIAMFVCLILYVLSSGPVLATAFWLREKTGWDGFYAVMFLYLPLLWLGHDQPVDAYIEWWAWLIGAPGPG